MREGLARMGKEKAKKQLRNREENINYYFQQFIHSPYFDVFALLYNNYTITCLSLLGWEMLKGRNRDHWFMSLFPFLDSFQSSHPINASWINEKWVHELKT